MPVTDLKRDEPCCWYDFNSCLRCGNHRDLVCDLAQRLCYGWHMSVVAAATLHPYVFFVWLCWQTSVSVVHASAFPTGFSSTMVIHITHFHTSGFAGMYIHACIVLVHHSAIACMPAEQTQILQTLSCSLAITHKLCRTAFW